MNSLKIYPLKCGFTLLGALVLCAICLNAATYDAAGDYLAGWNAGNNPNVPWSYGWSTTPGIGPLNLYYERIGPPGQVPQFDQWDAYPSNSIGYTPLDYLNNGPEFISSDLDLPAGALILHGGGTSSACGTEGACFSEVVWAAPTTGFFDLSATFTGVQRDNMRGLVEIIEVNGGTPTTLLFGNNLSFGGSYSLSTAISVTAGDTVVFAARTWDGSLAADSTQLAATLTSSSTPEPATFGLLLAGLGWIGFRTIRRRP